MPRLRMLPSALPTASAPGMILITRLNGWPAHALTDASPISSRRSAHGLVSI